MEIEDSYISRTTNIIIFIIGTILTTFNNIWNYYTSRNFPSWINYITGQSCEPIKTGHNFQGTITILTVFSIITLSLIMEIYIGVKIRNLPWRKLKTVTIG